MKNTKVFLLFSSLCLIGTMVCAICNLAISKALTWSLIPISCIVFSWIISCPIILFGNQGISKCLLLLSIFIIPFLYILSILINEISIFTIGAMISIISIIYLWCIFGIFKLLKTRKYKALGIAFLSMIPFGLLINSVLFKMILEPIIDKWDILLAFILLIVASIFLIYDYTNNKKQ